MIFFFFFQAEDGIRDVAVTGVQTCALPISLPRPRREIHARHPDLAAPDRVPAQLRRDRAAHRASARLSGSGCWAACGCSGPARSEEHTSELQSRLHLVCRLLLEKKKK